MPQVQEEQNLPEVPAEEEKSGNRLFLWIGLGVGSFLVVYVGTLMLLIHLGDPLTANTDESVMTRADTAAVQTVTESGGALDEPAEPVDERQEDQEDITQSEPAESANVPEPEAPPNQAEAQEQNLTAAPESSPADTSLEASVSEPEPAAVQSAQAQTAAMPQVRQEQVDQAAPMQASMATNPEPEEKSVDYKQLAKIYSQMDADAAAKILTQLEDDMVVGILREMRDRNAAQLLMVFDSKTAARLSRKLSTTEGES